MPTAQQMALLGFLPTTSCRGVIWTHAGLYLIGTFEGRSTDWATMPRLMSPHVWRHCVDRSYPNSTYGQVSSILTSLNSVVLVCGCYKKQQLYNTDNSIPAGVLGTSNYLANDTILDCFTPSLAVWSDIVRVNEQKELGLEVNLGPLPPQATILTTRPWLLGE